MESATETLASRPLPPATSLNSLGAARIVVPIVLEYAPARSVVDFGCKHGEWLSVFREHGCDRPLGFDQAKRITQGLLIDEREFTVADLRQPLLLQQRFDLAVCIEVAEHLPESAAAGLVKTLTRVAPIVLFSAALPGQGGHGHLNEQPRGYWDDLFRGDGYTAVDCLRPRIWQNAEVAWWYRQNLFMFFSAEALQQSPLRASAGRTNDIDLVHVDILNRPSLKRAAAAAIRGLARRIARRT